MIAADTSSPASGYRWVVLTLGTLTNLLLVAMPSMCMPVLFHEIGADLNLTLVELGLIWGIGSLPGIITVLLGGALSDQFGPRRVIMITCLLAGLAGALRGFATDFATLTAAVVLAGFLTSAVPMNVIKACGLWFPRRQLGLAAGVASMGMALGFMLGSLLSATVLSPLLGGWRNVIILYGLIGMALSIPWFFTRAEPVTVNTGAARLSFWQTLVAMIRIRKLWLLGLVIFGISGSIQGALGYLPLYLRGQGWADASADGALSLFHLMSMIFVIPIAIASDRLGSRKKLLVPAVLMIVTGFSLLSVVTGGAVWAAVSIAGLVRDGFMAVFITMIVETEGVGAAYTGTATGLVMVFAGLSNVIAPPLGNSLAAVSLGLPFMFWAGMAVIGLAALAATRERRAVPVVPGTPAVAAG